MGESEQHADTDFGDDDDLPDLSTPEWVAKFDKAAVNPSEPVDL